MEEEITKLDAKIDVNETPKGFEVKFQAEQTQKIITGDKNSEIPIMDRWVMKISGGTIKGKEQAERVLLVFAIILLLIDISLFLVVLATGHKNTLTPEQKAELLRMEQLQNTSGGSNPQ